MKQDEGFTTVTVEDIGCDPRIPKGARLLCSETLKPQNGDYILVRRADAPPLLRAYFVREDGSILLKSYNKDSDSYLTTEQGLASAGILVAVRLEYDFPASSRILLPDPEGTKAFSPPESHPPAVLPSLPSASPELLTFEEAQAMLKVRRTKMYALLRSGELRASKVGKLWRIERNSIQDYLAEKIYQGRPPRKPAPKKES